MMNGEKKKSRKDPFSKRGSTKLHSTTDISNKAGISRNAAMAKSQKILTSNLTKTTEKLSQIDNKQNSIFGRRTLVDNKFGGVLQGKKMIKNTNIE